MTHVDAMEVATPTEVLTEEPSEFSARFENGVVTHFEVKSGSLPVSTARQQARHVKGDAIASGIRRGPRHETAPISGTLGAGEFGASFETQTQPGVARIFQVRGKSRLPR